jgi:ribulose kinase
MPSSDVARSDLGQWRLGPCRDSIIPGYWMAEGGQSATGELPKHVLETYPAYKDAFTLAEECNTNIYDYLNDHLRDMQVRADAPGIAYLGRHFFFYGDLFSNRSPIIDPTMVSSVVGLSSDKCTDWQGR